jgi:hypothetical protein
MYSVLNGELLAPRCVVGLVGPEGNIGRAIVKCSQ